MREPLERMHADMAVAGTGCITPHHPEYQTAEIEAAAEREVYAAAVGEKLIAQVLAARVAFERVLPNAFNTNKMLHPCQKNIYRGLECLPCVRMGSSPLAKTVLPLDLEQKRKFKKFNP